ncbi:helix-turn-helix domain-containing protein, partial [Anaerostipes hadrus]|uniref:helix-turn-helix domain-containing protein n=1 Tax=Anaerostipes hadrus TaxID=649756 RepID=UPI001FD80ACC
VKVAFISNIENDRVKMNLRVLSYYAKLLNVSIDYLLRPESDENGENDAVLHKEILRLLDKFSTDDNEKFVKVLRILCNYIPYLRHKQTLITGTFRLSTN